MYTSQRRPGDFSRRLRERMTNAGFIHDIRNALYAVQVSPPDGPIKIGRAADPWRRWEGIMYTWPFEYNIQVWAMVQGAQDIEESVLSRLSASRIRGEWFNPTEEVRALLSLL